ncbi:hypothetical protein Clacol_005158 [Clathrus columnatus]|uniref:Carbonic anhydrase n=1 Tax=Clathrus columnatus TaxID=1419009 RepID=A0AAV5ADY3_9AGAM|nr:hypothetical protein Clacol_005158 [Clathrus columnatus]
MYPEGSLPASAVPAELLTLNARWAASVTNFDPNFFPNSAKGQSPREYRQQFPTNDLSSHCVLQFAINGPPDANHVIVVGHTSCGGVGAALNAARDGDPILPPLDQWLAPLVERIKKLPDLPNQTLNNVTKESVKMQIENVCNSDAIKSIKKTVYIHGWMYHLENGFLEDLYLTREIAPSGGGPAPGGN